jgi:hypothetical protein
MRPTSSLAVEPGVVVALLSTQAIKWFKACRPDLLARVHLITASSPLCDNPWQDLARKRVQVQCYEVHPNMFVIIIGMHDEREFCTLAIWSAHDGRSTTACLSTPQG